MPAVVIQQMRHNLVGKPRRKTKINSHLYLNA